MVYRRLSEGDRRRFQRLDLSINVLYRVDQPLEVRMKIGDKEIEATTINLSKGGMAFLTDYDIPVWSSLLIKFTLSRMDKEGKVSLYGPMEISGEVRSSIPLENKVRRLGICFIRIERKDSQEIINFLEAVRH